MRRNADRSASRFCNWLGMPRLQTMFLTNSVASERTMIGLDTGHFLGLLKGHAKAKQVWTAIMEGEEEAVSCLTLFELARFAPKCSIDQDGKKTLREAVNSLCRI
jgi:hypothetical protein